VLLLDEPLSNLDAKLRRHVREEIRQIQQELGLTAVYVTHDQEEAMAVSDRIIVMQNAEIAQEGSPHDLYERPSSAFIADFIGDANLVECEVLGASDGGAEIAVAGRKIMVPNEAKHKGTAKMVLRPHHIQLGDGGEGFTGNITYAAYLGNQIQYTLDGELGPLFAIADTTANPFSVGQNVKISFDPAEIRLVAG
jgi:iron(III) transport system ATP-binding protein